MDRLAKDENLDEIIKDRLILSMGLLENIYDGFGFCLSAEGDLLSQWRGYAADCTGISIGFSRKFFTNTKPQSDVISFDQVKYKDNEHNETVRNTYNELKKNIENGAFNPYPQNYLGSQTENDINKIKLRIKKETESAIIILEKLLPGIYFLKSESYKEEKEWRLVLSLPLKSVKLIENIQYRHNKNIISPYIVIKINKPSESIDEIILGPKNETPHKVIKNFLTNHGFEGISIKSSKLTYR